MMGFWETVGAVLVGNLITLILLGFGAAYTKKKEKEANSQVWPAREHL